MLLEAVRWQPPSLSTAPCPLRGWGGAIALHPRAPQRCDRKAWLAVTRPHCRGTPRRGEQARKREGTQVVSEQLHGGVILSIRQHLERGWGWLGCVRVCVRPRCERDPSSGTLLGHITYMEQWQRWPLTRLDGLVGEKVAWNICQREGLPPPSPHVELTQQPVEYRLLRDGRNDCVFYFFSPQVNNYVHHQLHSYKILINYHVLLCYKRANESGAFVVKISHQYLMWWREMKGYGEEWGLGPLWDHPCHAWCSVLKSGGSFLATWLFQRRTSYSSPPSAPHLHLELPAELWLHIYCYGFCGLLDFSIL